MRDRGIRVMGVDPSLSATGYGVIEDAGDGKIRLVRCGVIKPDGGLPLELKLTKIYSWLGMVVEDTGIEAMVMEDVYVGKNNRTAVLMGRVGGAVLLAAGMRRVPVYRCAPTHIKALVSGYGFADKESMGKAVSLILGIEEQNWDDDISDAIAAGIVYFRDRCALNEYH